jgi:hypothetical protein
MDINDRLYVEIVPMTGPHAPHPNPLTEGRFDPDYIYKVLGSYNPSETSECYFALANRDREIWFIPQRHLRAFKLIDSDEFSLPRTNRLTNGRDGFTNGNGKHLASTTSQG